MDDFKEKQINLISEEQKETLKNSLTTIVENYKMLLIRNNSITGFEKQRIYNDLEHNIAIIEFITQCKLDKGVLWEGMDNKE